MLRDVSEPEPPAAIVDLAEQRSRARSEGQWARADELRAAIETAGWRIEDAGIAFRLSPAHPPDLVVDGTRYHGAPESVPSRLAAPASTRATLAVIVDTGDAHEALLRSIEAHALPDTQVVVVAARGVPVHAPHHELVGTATPFSAGQGLQTVLRCATGELVVVLAPDRLISGDILAPIEAALRDPEVAAVGSAGFLSADLRRFSEAPLGEVVALRSGGYAFRRDDAGAVDPVDARLDLADSAAVWLSLALRDRGPGRPPRRAFALELPVTPQPDPDDGARPDETTTDARRARRDAYRIADRFAACTWLALSHEEVARMPGDRAHGHEGYDDRHEQEHTAKA